jgi:hypothetical protein
MTEIVNILFFDSIEQIGRLATGVKYDSQA